MLVAPWLCVAYALAVYDKCVLCSLFGCVLIVIVLCVCVECVLVV